MFVLIRILVVILELVLLLVLRMTLRASVLLRAVASVYTFTFDYASTFILVLPILILRAGASFRAQYPQCILLLLPVMKLEL